MNTQTQHTHGLERRLTSAQVSMIGLAGALGTGLFLGSGSTIAFGGPGTILSYLLAGMLALIVVWEMAEMVSVHPVPGGFGAVAGAYVGPWSGFVVRWNLVVTFVIAIGAEVTAAGTYLQHWFVDLPLWAGTVACAIFIFALNLLTVRLYGTSEYWFSMIKVTAIVVFIVLGLSLIFFGWPSPNPPTGFANLTAHGGFAPNGIGGILIAACLSVFSFGGLETVAVTAAEAEHPERDVPKAARNMIIRLLLFYVLAIAVVVTLQPWNATVTSGSEVTASPFVRVMDLVGIPAAGHIMNAILIVAALSAANGCLYTASRMIHSLALDGLAPRIAGETARNGTPRMAIAVAAIGVAVTAALAIFTPTTAFFYLSGCATIGTLVGWAFISMTHLAFRKRRAHYEEETGISLPTPPARLWGAPFTSWLVIIAAIAIYVALAVPMPEIWIAGIPYLAALVIAYALVKKFHGVSPQQSLSLE
ncbi:MAG: amino acid permease [Actinomycetaceae bacterium]|nr:amino acid permease [Actinomycetaceae bacterium]MDY5853984.1 amino acid permease [Arcanobacterium sp.]